MLSLDRQNYWRGVYQSEHPGWRPATEVFAGLVRRELRVGGRLLDLGCGRGGILEQITDTEMAMVGIDPDFYSLRHHRMPELPRAVATSHVLPITNGSFDVVVASWLLEHVAKPLHTWNEIRRILRPGGAFIFLTPNARHPLTWANRVFGRMGRFQKAFVARLYSRSEADTFPTQYRSNTEQALNTLARDGGLQLEELNFVADPSYLAFSDPMYRLSCALDKQLAHDRHIHLVGLARKPSNGFDYNE